MTSATSLLPTAHLARPSAGPQALPLNYGRQQPHFFQRAHFECPHPFSIVTSFSAFALRNNLFM